MILTKPSDDIKDPLDFLGQMTGPEVLRGRTGAEPEDIARFATLAKFPLPPLYVGYLQEFGAQKTEC
jgi:hypothetical protein